jgi:hypothetical protein
MKKIKCNKKYQQTNLSASINGPLYDMNGKCFANCAQRSFIPKHNLTLGQSTEISKSGLKAGLYGGYELNPNPGRRQEGFKGYLGANAGGKLSGVNVGDWADGGQGSTPVVEPYANAVVTAGYEGEVGAANSYKNYLRGRRGDPMKWGIGGYATKDILNSDGGMSFGGYGHYGKLNVSGGYNTKTGPEAKIGIGIPIR